MIAALILAGGQATRMGGGDKCLLDLGGGETLMARLLRTLAADHAAIALSANGDPARFAIPHPVLPDPVAGQGPLAGVLAGLDWAAGLGASALLSVPGDTPLVPPNLAATLGPAPAVARTEGRLHHLVALWPVAAGPALRHWLARPGPRSVRAFADTLGMRPVDFAGDPFANVNTPADLERLRNGMRAGM